jgi:hypothetical protein
LLVLAVIISSTLKIEAICSSETSVATQQTTRRHIPEDDTLHNHRCEDPKFPGDYEELRLLLLIACFMLVSFLAYFTILKMEATCSSDTSVYF